MIIIEDYDRFIKVPQPVDPVDIASAIERSAKAAPGSHITLTFLLDLQRAEFRYIASVLQFGMTKARRIKMKPVVRDATITLGFSTLGQLGLSVAELDWPTGRFNEDVSVSPVDEATAAALLSMSFDCRKQLN